MQMLPLEWYLIFHCLLFWCKLEQFFTSTLHLAKQLLKVQHWAFHWVQDSVQSFAVLQPSLHSSILIFPHVHYHIWKEPLPHPRIKCLLCHLRNHREQDHLSKMTSILIVLMILSWWHLFLHYHFLCTFCHLKCLLICQAFPAVQICLDNPFHFRVRNQRFEPAEGQFSTVLVDLGTHQGGPSLPLLSGAGWIKYKQKTHGSFRLQQFNKVKQR